MSNKIVPFFVIVGSVFSFSQVSAFAEISRQGIISAALDTIEQDQREKQDLTSNFFSDFSIRSPLLDIFSLYRRWTSPILMFDGIEDGALDRYERNLAIRPAPDTESELDYFSGLVRNIDLGGLELYFGTHCGYLSGHTNYEISFDGGRSELEFPLDNMGVSGVRFGVVIPQTGFTFDNAFYVNLVEASGTMKDTDWGANEATISDTNSDALIDLLIWDTHLDCVFWRNGRRNYDYNNNTYNLSLSALGGYRHEYFKYDIRDVYNAWTGACTTTGSVLEYRVTYNIPYFGLKLNFGYERPNRGLNDLSISTRACFSPFVRANDFDDHLLRGKRSIAECQGWAGMLGLDIFYHFSDSWTLQGGIDYAKIQAAGEQVQRWYLDEGDTPAGYTIGGIDDKIYSNQVLFWGRLNYRF